MSYQIRKGWPAEAAIDEIMVADDGEEIVPGLIVAVEGGKCKVANFTGAASDTDPMPAFVIAGEKVRGTFTGLMSQCIIEVDADHYEAGTYKPGDMLTAKAGKFAAAGSSKAVARVMNFDAGSGIMRLMWYESR